MSDIITYYLILTTPKRLILFDKRMIKSDNKSNEYLILSYGFTPIMRLIHILKNGCESPEDLIDAHRKAKRNMIAVFGIMIAMLVFSEVFGPFKDDNDLKILADIIFIPTLIFVMLLVYDAIIPIEGLRTTCKALAGLDKGLYTSVDDLVFELGISPKRAKRIVNGEFDVLKSEKTYQDFFED